jgi:small conductance mechanosensitive channel
MEWLEEVFGIKYTDVNQFLVRIGTNLLLCIIILVAGFWLAKVLSKGLRRVLRKSNTDEGLVTFATSFISMVLKILVVVTAISQLGIEMTSFVALLGAAGLAIGMAFSGTLSNFAGGIMILVLKPFRVGDLVFTQGEKGIVKEIQIFNTYLHTTDNKVIILPNGPVANGNIINFTKADTRRVDWLYSIAYGDDFEKAKKLIEQFIKEDARIISDPEAFIGIQLLTSSSVDLTVQVWVKTDDVNPVFYSMNERVYREFEEAGLHFPFPQMDVHLKSNGNA